MRASERHATCHIRVSKSYATCYIRVSKSYATCHIRVSKSHTISQMKLRYKGGWDQQGSHPFLIRVCRTSKAKFLPYAGKWDGMCRSPARYHSS